MQRRGLVFHAVVGGTVEVAVNHHIVEHHIAARHASLRILLGIVTRSGFQQAHERGALVNREAIGGGVVIGACGGFDTECAIAEVHCVGIHGDDLVFRKLRLNHQRQQNFLGFHNQDAQARNLAQQTGGILGAHLEHVFYQLLRDGGSTTGALMHDKVFSSTAQALEVHAAVVVEALVLGVDKCLEKQWRHFFELHRRTVFVEEFAQQLPIGTVNVRCVVGLWVHDAADRWRLAKQPHKVEKHHQ